MSHSHNNQYQNNQDQNKKDDRQIKFNLKFSDPNVKVKKESNKKITITHTLSKEERKQKIHQTYMNSRSTRQKGEVKTNQLATATIAANVVKIIREIRQEVFSNSMIKITESNLMDLIKNSEAYKKIERDKEVENLLIEAFGSELKEKPTKENLNVVINYIVTFFLALTGKEEEKDCNLTHEESCLAIAFFNMITPLDKHMSEIGYLYKKISKAVLVGGLSLNQMKEISEYIINIILEERAINFIHETSNEIINYKNELVKSTIEEGVSEQLVEEKIIETRMNNEGEEIEELEQKIEQTGPFECQLLLNLCFDSDKINDFKIAYPKFLEKDHFKKHPSKEYKRFKKIDKDFVETLEERYKRPLLKAAIFKIWQNLFQNQGKSPQLNFLEDKDVVEEAKIEGYYKLVKELDGVGEIEVYFNKFNKRANKLAFSLKESLLMHSENYFNQVTAKLSKLIERLQEWPVVSSEWDQSQIAGTIFLLNDLLGVGYLQFTLLKNAQNHIEYEKENIEAFKKIEERLMAFRTFIDTKNLGSSANVSKRKLDEKLIDLQSLLEVLGRLFQSIEGESSENKQAREEKIQDKLEALSGQLKHITEAIQAHDQKHFAHTSLEDLQNIKQTLQAIDFTCLQNREEYKNKCEIWKNETVAMVDDKSKDLEERKSKYFTEINKEIAGEVNIIKEKLLKQKKNLKYDTSVKFDFNKYKHILTSKGEDFSKETFENLEKMTGKNNAIKYLSAYYKNPDDFSNEEKTSKRKGKSKKLKKQTSVLRFMSVIKDRNQKNKNEEEENIEMEKDDRQGRAKSSRGDEKKVKKDKKSKSQSPRIKKKNEIQKDQSIENETNREEKIGLGELGLFKQKSRTHVREIWPESLNNTDNNTPGNPN